jgi:hypothetical protein
MVMAMDMLVGRCGTVGVPSALWSKALKCGRTCTLSLLRLLWVGVCLIVIRHAHLIVCVCVQLHQYFTHMGTVSCTVYLTVRFISVSCLSLRTGVKE